jgi:hypothetical protein
MRHDRLPALEPRRRPVLAAPARRRVYASRYGIAPIGEQQARAFVTALHYSRSYPAAVRRYGMFDLTGPAPELAGVAVLSVPASTAVLTKVFPRLEPCRESLELGRFVLLDQVAARSRGSWASAPAWPPPPGCAARSCSPTRSRAAAPTAPWSCPATWASSTRPATRSPPVGPGTARTLTLLPDGAVFSDRSAQKIRSQECGHEGAERRLINFGARPPRAGQNPASWLADALADVHARKIRHPGCHRYAFPLGTRRQRATVTIAPRPGPYPKKHLGQLSLFEDAA